MQRIFSYLDGVVFMDVLDVARYSFFMLLVEIVLVIALAVFTAHGAKAGFVKSLGQLIATVLAFVAAKAWSPEFGRLIEVVLPRQESLARFLAFFVIFLIVDRLLGFFLRLVAGLLGIVTRLPIISSVNALLGAVLGFGEGIVLVGSLIYLVTTLRFSSLLLGWVNGSVVAGYTERVFYTVLGYFL